MQCELCHVNEATVHLKQVFEGGIKAIHVCQECAEKSGFNVQSPISMMDFLFGLDMQGGKPGAEDKTCHACGMRLGDFRKNSRLGCGECYQAFREELRPLLSSIHKGTSHRGKIPAREKMSAEVASLHKALKQAVGSQNFEEAARLRDRIRTLTGSMPAVNSRRRVAAQDQRQQLATDK